MEYPAGTITKQGNEHPVYVNDFGQWKAYLNDEPVQADSKDALEKKMTTVLRKQKIRVSIPFIAREGEKVRRGVVTGEHAGNSTVLVTWADGSKENMSPTGGWNQRLLAPMEDAEAREWVRLYNASIEASKALTDFEHERPIDLRKLIEAEIKAALEAQQG